MKSLLCTNNRLKTTRCLRTIVALLFGVLVLAPNPSFAVSCNYQSYLEEGRSFTLQNQKRQWMANSIRWLFGLPIGYSFTWDVVFSDGLSGTARVIWVEREAIQIASREQRDERDLVRISGDCVVKVGVIATYKDDFTALPSMQPSDITFEPLVIRQETDWNGNDSRAFVMSGVFVYREGAEEYATRLRTDSAPVSGKIELVLPKTASLSDAIAVHFSVIEFLQNFGE
ncbi:MAG: hypothetical protein AAGJ34_06625 [Pseudomonadota bacterium]